MDGKIKLAGILALFVALVAFSMVVFAPPGGAKKCNNGIDDDNDGRIDLQDPGCSNKNDETETSSSLICDNGRDEANDADTKADYRLSNGDPGCTSPTDSSEVDGQCDDKLDNDGDGKTDYGITSSHDSKCSSFSDNDESPRDNCNDAEGGVYPEVRGTVSGDDESVPYSKTDSCISSVLLNEYYCGNKNQDYAPLNFTINCNTNSTTVCSNGACQ